MYGEHIGCPSTPCATATTTATHRSSPRQSAEAVLPPPSSSLLPAVWISFGVSLCALYAWLNARLHCGDARSTGCEERGREGGGELPPSLSLPCSLAAGDDASRKDHYWNSCHPHPLPLSSPLSRNWGSSRLAGQKVKRGPLEQRKRGSIYNNAYSNKNSYLG